MWIFDFQDDSIWIFLRFCHSSPQGLTDWLADWLNECSGSEYRNAMDERGDTAWSLSSRLVPSCLLALLGVGEGVLEKDEDGEDG